MDNQLRSEVGVVVIGRNEGQRLISCLASIGPEAGPVVYVDSGSTDGSQDAASAHGATVIELDLNQPFTAARARNTGFAYVSGLPYPPGLVQFIDGDCDLQPDWLSTARAYMQDNPSIAAVCGRRREKHPDASVYNRLIDQEWDTPIGETKACGGDAMYRTDALQAVDGFNPDLIAGEEPELCVRLRASGWKVWRLNAEMTLHDANLTRFSQWWRRNKRAGFAYAEGVALHGAPPERHGLREARSALIWGAVLPLLILIGALAWPWMLLGALIWPIQVLRLWRRDKDMTRAAFLTLGKFPEAQGVLSYVWQRVTGVRRRLIEYK